MYFRYLAAILLVLIYSHSAGAFVIKDIEVQGLERVSAGRFFSEFPLRVGDEMDVSQSPQIINTLYRTGLFDNIILLEDNGILVIEVVERPGINSIDITGNQTIPEEALFEGLERANITTGVVFDRLAFERLKQELKEQYYGIGKYGAKINADIEELPDNQVRLMINISEGEVATIKQVKITGNHAVKDKELLDMLLSGTKSWYMFWSGKDEYSQAKLAADLETLQNFYFNKGYLDFKVDDTRVTLSRDKKDIYIDVEVSEGGRYRVGDIALSGKSVLDEKKILGEVSLKKGQYFSRVEAIRSSDRIRFQLKDNGYAFADVVALPQTHVEEGTVDVAFIIQPKKKTMVNRINIRGNDTTSDKVLRREIRQLEGSEYSASKIELSKRRLQRLPYLSEVQIKDFPVPDKEDQIDLDIDVAERVSGNFNIGAGYSNSSGAVLSFGLNQDNFLGTGNRVNFAFSNNDSDTNYGIGFYNPFYTIDGVSRSWNLSYRSVDYEDLDITDILSSSSDEISASLSYGIPLSENDVVRLGGRLEDISISLNEAEVQSIRDNNSDNCISPTDCDDPTQPYDDYIQQDIVDCIEQYGGSFQNFSVNGNFDYDTRDRSLFPTEGTKIDSSLQFYTPLSDSKYVKADYSQRHYFQLDDDADFVFSARGRVSYARAYDGSCIPYFDRFYAGGTKTVRGYASNSLGPRDNDDDPAGGNFRVLGNIDLIFPTDFLYDRKKLRMSAFLDFGNVFANAEEFSASDIRGSYGLQVQWLTAIGAISFNFSSPFGDDDTDEPESFQFDLGTAY